MMLKTFWTAWLLCCGLALCAEPVIPEVIYAVPGKECNVYFYNLAPNGTAGNVEVTTPTGRQDEKRWRFTPKAEDAGKSFPLQIEWKDLDGKILNVCKSTVKVAPPVQKKKFSILIMGDSVIEASRFPVFLSEQLKRDGYDVHFIGSHIGGGKPAVKPGDVLHEGIGGWSFLSFTNRWVAEGVKDFDHYKKGRSHFLTGPGKFDFQAYLNKYNKGKAPDFVFISLGGNDIAGCTDANIHNRLTAASNSFDIIVNGIRKAAPRAVIGFGLLYPGASQDAFGNNYNTLIRQAQFHRNLRKLWAMLTEKYHNDKGQPRISLVPISVGVDTEHHYPVRLEPAAEGSSVKVSRQSNALHPYTGGQQQVAGIIYSWLRNHLQ